MTQLGLCVRANQPALPDPDSVPERMLVVGCLSKCQVSDVMGTISTAELDYLQIRQMSCVFLEGLEFPSYVVTCTGMRPRMLMIRLRACPSENPKQ